MKGLVSVDDIINLSDTNGISLASAITDWLRFENIFRGWRKNGAFPGLGARGNCSTGTCNIWDFRLDSSDTRFRNTTADGVNQNAAFISGGACPSYLSGNVVSVSVNGTPRTYLTNAIEPEGITTAFVSPTKLVFTHRTLVPFREVAITHKNGAL